MEILGIVLVVVVGLYAFGQLLHQSWSQWHYGRLNRRDLEQWRQEYYRRKGV
ncbi:MAG: hypothetical protein J2P36_12315 [Ktedonobacteraceae bacterium]|nr:hypothetical protein [Ktedonobacteraceae bacterium]